MVNVKGDSLCLRERFTVKYLFVIEDPLQINVVVISIIILPGKISSVFRQNKCCIFPVKEIWSASSQEGTGLLG